jgi:hypothetical protein
MVFSIIAKENYNLPNKLAGSCETNGETLTGKNILYAFSEGKTRSRETNEEMEIPGPGDRCWSRNRLIN